MAIVDYIAKQIRFLEGIIQSVERRQRFIEDFSRQNRQLATFYQDALRSKLAHRGWFIAGTLYPSQYKPLAQLFKQGREHEIEQFLKDHTEKNIPAIRKGTLSRWPIRECILTDAFDIS